MKLPNRLFPLAGLALLLGACNGNDNNGTPGTAAPAGVFSQISTRDANSTPAMLNDPQGLFDELTAIFGGANGTPTDVQAGDSVVDVVTRAGG